MIYKKLSTKELLTSFPISPELIIHLNSLLQVFTKITELFEQTPKIFNILPIINGNSFNILRKYNLFMRIIIRNYLRKK